VLRVEVTRRANEKFGLRLVQEDGSAGVKVHSLDSDGGFAIPLLFFLH
jgi:hypothetical protein